MLKIAEAPLAKIIWDLREYLMLYMYAPFSFDRRDLLKRLEEMVEIVDRLRVRERFGLQPDGCQEVYYLSLIHI